MTEIKQSEIFTPIGFRKCAFGSEVCYKGPDGRYYRVSRFGDHYVAEYAQTEREAKTGLFFDVDSYGDSLPKSELLRLIQRDLRACSEKKS